MAELYKISLPDFDFHYYPTRGKDRPRHIYCPACCCRKSDWMRPYDDRARRLVADLQNSYDGALIVSADARAFLEQNASTTISFHRFYRNAFLAIADARLEWDFDRLQPPQREDFCQHCGEHAVDLWLGHNAIRNAGIIDENGFYFSDVRFGSCPDKHHLRLVGCTLGKKFADAFPEVCLLDFPVLR